MRPDADPARRRQLEDVRHPGRGPRAGTRGARRAQAPARGRGGGVPALHRAARGGRGAEGRRGRARRAELPLGGPGRVHRGGIARDARGAGLSLGPARTLGATARVPRDRRRDQPQGRGRAPPRHAAGALRGRDGRGAAPGAHLHGGGRAAPRRLVGALPRGSRALRPGLRAGVGHRYRGQRDPRSPTTPRRSPRSRTSTASWWEGPVSRRPASSPSPRSPPPAAALRRSRAPCSSWS
jgi:hypothetical protein